MTQATTSDPVLAWEGYAYEAERATGVPASTLLGLIRVESGGREGLTSRTGAKGVTQFEPATATSYGVDVTPGHARSQIFGAARYLKDLGYSKDPARALASYNAGPGNWQAGSGYATKVLTAARSYAGATDATGTPAAGGGEPTNQGWGTGLLSPLFGVTEKALLYVALIGAGAFLVFIGTKHATGSPA